MDQSAAITTARDFAERVAAQLAPEQIILYGSYAQGTPNDESDIDVAVIYHGFEGSYLETSSLLWSIARGVSADIEPILLDTQDDRSGFAAHIITTGQVVYQS